LPAEVLGRRGRPRIWPLRRIVEAILYLDRAECAWRYLSSDYLPWGTEYCYFAARRDDGTLARLHDAPRAQVRAAARPLLWNLYRSSRRIRLIWTVAARERSSEIPRFGCERYG
jgi:transposase